MSQMELRHPSPPPRPPGPMPPEFEDYIGQLRETIDVQARTIRFLLSNYEHLLRKVEKHEGEEDVAEYTVGALQNFTTGAVIAAGFWIPTNSVNVRFSNFAGGTHDHEVESWEPFFSDGTATARGALHAAPVNIKIVRVTKEEEEA